MPGVNIPRRSLLAAPFVLTPGRAASPAATLLSTRIISEQPQDYIGWPTLIRRSNGELIVAYSGGREAHVCPFGRVEIVRSKDNGDTWSWPEVLMDTAIDDRDAGALETATGALLVTTFTSLAYEPLLEKATGWEPARLARWQAVNRRTTPEQRKALLGTWMLRSADGGMTWSAPYRVPVNSPHGPVQASKGRLWYPGKQLWDAVTRVGIATSGDDGRTWKWSAAIPTRPGDDVNAYHELHGVEAADGRWIVHIRNHNKVNERETLQTESTDGGKSWSVPRAIGVWGLPSHLLRLRDGRLVMAYSHRRDPRGNQARVSADHGRTWSEPLMLSVDGTGDLGYPSTVELADGRLVTIWYEKLASAPKAVLRMATWRLG